MSWAVTLGLLAGEVLAALLLGFVWFCVVTWCARLIVRAVDGRATPQDKKKGRPRCWNTRDGSSTIGG